MTKCIYKNISINIYSVVRKHKQFNMHIVLCLCFVFLRHVYIILPVSQDYPILITPSVFSNVYLAKSI